MKRKLQDDQWADDLRAWENSPSSEAWDRPSAAMWGRIAEDLPPEKSKKAIGWWLAGVFVILLSGVAGIFYFSSQTNTDIKARQPQLPTVNSSEGLALDANNQLASQTYIKANSQHQVPMSRSGENLISATHEPALSSKLPTEEQTNGKTNPENVVYTSQPAEKRAVADKEKEVAENQFTTPTEASHPPKETANQPIIEKLDFDKAIANHTEHDHPEDLNNKKHSPKTDQLLAPIPSLHFMVQMPELSLTNSIFLSKSALSLWSVDIYGQKIFTGSQRFRSPHIQKKKAQTYSYGVQLNRKLPKGFSLHTGLQETRSITNGVSRFIRIYNHHNEMSVGTRRVSEFNLTTELGEDNLIDDNVKIERSEDETVEDQTRLIFQVERQFSLKTYSIPLQLGYSLWSQYPFKLTGLLGAKFSRTEQVIKNISVTVNNPKFNIRQVRTGRPMHTQKSTNIALLAGLRLDVQLSPKISAITQIDYQAERSRQRSPFTSPGSSLLRVGLSYKL